MSTLFECWNGCVPRWDGWNPPSFDFQTPTTDWSVIQFFQFSAGIAEVMTRAQWVLNMGGQVFDVPDLAPQEVELALANVRARMGYAFVTVPFAVPGPMGVQTLPVGRWVSLWTGRADVFTPFHGAQFGPVLIPPQPAFRPPTPAAPLAFGPGPGGGAQASGGGETLKNLATLVSGCATILQVFNEWA